MLKKKLEEISSGKQDFYKNINHQRLASLHKNIDSGKQLEDLIFKTLNSIDSLKQNHEDAACIFVKINEVQEMIDKMLIKLDNEIESSEELNKNIIENNSVISKNLNYLKDRFENIKKNKK